jgi:hypothetical protein
MKYDFTTYKYRSFLEHLIDINFPIYTISDWIEKQPKNGIILRHDVDRNTNQAIKIATIASECNVKGTFNFRVLRNKVDEKAITIISKLGHEIGYHYEDLSIAKGNIKLAIKLFDNNLQLLRKFSDVKTATMHGRPLSKFDNRQIWETTNVFQFDLIGEAYVSIDYSNLYYLTDTGRTWSETKANLRDSAMNSLHLPKNIKSTEDIKNFINTDQQASIAIVFHPERWSSNYFHLFLQQSIDFISSTIKKILRLLR